MCTRSTIINTVILAKIWYVASVIEFTRSFHKEIDRIIYSFLWRPSEWIARNVLINAIFGGGLGLTHVRVKVKAIRLMQIVQILKDPDTESSVLARFVIR